MAHSMGGFLLFRSFPKLDKNLQNTFGSVIFVAADVRKNEIRKHFDHRFHRGCQSYICHHDKALKWSKMQCGGHVRMGRSAVHANHLTNISISKSTAHSQDKSLHTYFCATEVTHDISLVIDGVTDPHARHLRPRKHTKNGWCLPTQSHKPTPTSVDVDYTIAGEKDETSIDSENGQEQDDELEKDPDNKSSSGSEAD